MKHLLCAAACLWWLCGCGSANGPAAPPVVQAQNTFTSATLSGTYLIATSSVVNTSDFVIVGTLQFNGAGFVSGGSFVGYFPVGAGALHECGPINVLSGSTYSIDGTGALQVSLNYNSSPQTCGVQNNMVGVVQQSGQGFVFAGGGASEAWEGTALKQ
jgi:hypothetical protein